MSDVPNQAAQAYWAACNDCSDWWFAVLAALVGCCLLAGLILWGDR